MTTLAATGQDEYHRLFRPLTPGFLYAEANDCAALRALVEGDESVAAIMFELVQGEGGVLPLEYDFAQCIRELCAERDILMVCDEVQTGNGRTGTLYAYMQYGIAPDIVTTAKGLGGGLPIGACLMGEKVKDTMTPGTHGSTFGGNPAVCAGALNILSRIDDALLAEVRAKGEYIVNELKGAPRRRGRRGPRPHAGSQDGEAAGRGRGRLPRKRASWRSPRTAGCACCPR